MSLQSEILNEMLGHGGGDAKRWVTHSGQKGLYNLAKADEDAPMAERKKFDAIILYVPADPGRALWPDGKVFQGEGVICQSERSAPGMDRARLGKVDGATLSLLKSHGHTGYCGNCAVPTTVCKLQLVAYILDLEHVKEVDAHNERVDSGELTAERQEVCYTKLSAKGPQSYWNFFSCFKKSLLSVCRKDKVDPTAVVVRFSNEDGAMNSRKVKFEVVGKLRNEDRLKSLADSLAAEAYADANTAQQQSFSHPNEQRSLPEPADDFEVEEFVVGEEPLF